MSTLSFPRSARLLTPDAFAGPLKGRRVATGALLMLHAGPAVAGVPRLGLVVGKRHAPLAVTRNAIKRVVREAFRHQAATLPPADYAMRLHRRVGELSLTVLKRQVRAEADAHFARARRQAGPRPNPGGQP
ncbi:ribonuclease P protein component [Achromobacter sp. GG226]|uniref:ribonuclease P protein component n=1 Tax=Verticiella alkaliphila TaxID=2779529 RepID=UPI001C0ABF5E|nr:ribonuclease P protein component [Verticiella sp. GG226]MBU4609358.1 ribonuclease P protein component [Verticiella sp. GG226]